MFTTDNELLGQFVSGESRKSLEQLIRRHGPMVLAVCQSLTWSREDAEDAYQASFLVLSRKAHCLLNHPSVAGWLHQVAVRHCLNLRRKKGRRREVALTEEPLLDSLEPWRTISEIHDRETVQRELGRLPKRYREVLVLCHIEGRSRVEAAEMLECTTASIKASLARAKSMLRKRLVRKGVVASSVLVALASGTKASAAALPKAELTLGLCLNEAPRISTDSVNLINALAHQELVGMKIVFGKIAAVFCVVATSLALPFLLGDNEVTARQTFELRAEDDPTVSGSVQVDGEAGDSNTSNGVQLDANATNDETTIPSAGYLRIRSGDEYVPRYILRTQAESDLINRFTLDNVVLEPTDESIKYWELKRKAAEYRAQASDKERSGHFDSDEARMLSATAITMEERATEIQIGLLIKKLKAAQHQNSTIRYLDPRELESIESTDAAGSTANTISDGFAQPDSTGQDTPSSEPVSGESNDGGGANTSSSSTINLTSANTSNARTIPGSTTPVQPGEVLTIEFQAERRTLVVSEDQVITLPLAGEISLKDLTQKQIRELVNGMLGEFYKEPFADVYRGEIAQKTGDEIPLASTEPVQPGEALTLAFMNPRHMSRTIHVQGDHSVTIPLVGIIKARGLTPAELTTKVKLSLKQFVKDPMLQIYRGGLDDPRDFRDLD